MTKYSGIGGFLTKKTNSLKFKNVNQVICKAEMRKVCPMTPAVFSNLVDPNRHYIPGDHVLAPLKAGGPYEPGNVVRGSDTLRGTHYNGVAGKLLLAFAFMLVPRWWFLIQCCLHSVLCYILR